MDKTINCSIFVPNNDSKFFFKNDNKKRLTSVSIKLIWDWDSKKLYLNMYPLNIVDCGCTHIAADVQFPSPYEFNLEIAKGTRNSIKESELLIKYLKDNAQTLVNAYNEDDKQGIVDVICGYKHKMKGGLKQTTRKYYVMERDSYGHCISYHKEYLSPDMIGDKLVVKQLSTAFALIQD